MKKFLSMVLALVMALSLVTISAGATSFSDGSNIKYPEAAELLHGLNIHAGFDDGTYSPQNQMSRGFVAKCIAMLMLGKDEAEKLILGKSPFKDVSMDYRYAPYVNYLAKQGIISGYGDGTFRPSDEITVTAFVKMAMGALGYKANIEGYTGAGWQDKVMAAAREAGVLNEIEYFEAALIRRDEGAQVLMNTLLGTAVEYVGNSGASAVKNAATTYDATEGATPDGIMQLCEKSMPTLQKNTKDVDFLEREGTGWYLKGKQIAFVLD